MSSEKERVYELIQSSLVEVEKILGKKKKKRLKTGNWFFLSIEETLTILKNNIESSEDLDKSTLDQVDKMISASVRIIEDTSLFEKLIEIREYFKGQKSISL